MRCTEKEEKRKMTKQYSSVIGTNDAEQKNNEIHEFNRRLRENEEAEEAEEKSELRRQIHTCVYLIVF